MNPQTFDVATLPPSQRPSWFNLVMIRAISGGCQETDEAQAWEEEVKKCINEDPHAVDAWHKWKTDMASGCGLGDDVLQTVYIQWVYLRAMGRLECAHDVLQLAHSQLISQGLQDFFKENPLGNQEEEYFTNFTSENRTYEGVAAPQPGTSNAKELLKAWHNAFFNFFFVTQNSEGEKLAVSAMKDMKYIASRRDFQDTFGIKELQDVGLPALLLKISAPDTKLETSSAFMATSFLKYKWKESLLWFLKQCTPGHLLQPPDDTIIDPHTKPAYVPDALDFLEMVDSTSAIPFVSNPHSIFVFCSLDNFVAGVQDCMNANWVLCGHEPLKDQQLPQLYRSICQLDSQKINSLHVSEVMKVILLESLTLRHLRKSLLTAEHKAYNDMKTPGPSGRCLRCKDESPENRCVRVLMATLDQQHGLHGAVLVPHSLDDPDSAVPKTIKKRSTSGQVARAAKQTLPPRRLPLASISLDKIGERPEVRLRCGRDVTLIVDKNGDEAGGMIFGAFTDNELQALKKDSKTFLKTGNLCRGSDFQPWRLGKMKPFGSRQPAGGRTGDTYTVYPGMQIEQGNVQKVKEFFRHGKDVEMVLAKVQPYAPKVVSGLKADSKNCNKLGQLGVTSYYCWNYTAPQHNDHDHGWSICTQLEKSSRLDEYNFAYTDWGHYLETRTNCLWWFKGEHTHGTVMPRQSSVANPNCMSHGFTFTVPEKSWRKGNELKCLRRSYPQLQKLWCGT